MVFGGISQLGWVKHGLRGSIRVEGGVRKEVLEAIIFSKTFLHKPQWRERGGGRENNLSWCSSAPFRCIGGQRWPHADSDPDSTFGRCCGRGFRVQGSGFRVQGSGFRVQGSGSREHVRPLLRGGGATGVTCVSSLLSLQVLDGP